MSAITDEVRKLVAALEAEGHHLADAARSILTKLKGDEQHLQHDAALDATKLEAHAAPVIAEAETAAHDLAAEVVADVHTLPAPTEPEPPAAA